MDQDRHQDRVALVTGAGSGIGRATVLRLVAEGGTVMGCDIDAASLSKLESVLGEQQFAGAVGDISSPGGVQDVVDQTIERFGRVDVLANVAGVLDGYRPIHRMPDEVWRRTMAVNVDGPMMLSRAVLPGMMERGAGAIVNVASVGALRGGIAGAAYTTSKHAVIGMTRSMAWTYATSGVRCNAVCPGSVATGIRETPEAGIGDQWGYDRLETVRASRVTRCDPDEIAALVSWLASDEASNVSGAIVTADGGWTAG